MFLPPLLFSILLIQINFCLASPLARDEVIHWLAGRFIIPSIPDDIAHAVVAIPVIAPPTHAYPARDKARPAVDHTEISMPADGPFIGNSAQTEPPEEPVPVQTPNKPVANTPEANTPEANTPEANTPEANTPEANTPKDNPQPTPTPPPPAIPKAAETTTLTLPPTTTSYPPQPPKQTPAIVYPYPESEIQYPTPTSSSSSESESESESASYPVYPSYPEQYSHPVYYSYPSPSSPSSAESTTYEPSTTPTYDYWSSTSSTTDLATTDLGSLTAPVGQTLTISSQAVVLYTKSSSFVFVPIVTVVPTPSPPESITKTWTEGGRTVTGVFAAPSDGQGYIGNTPVAPTPVQTETYAPTPPTATLSGPTTSTAKATADTSTSSPAAPAASSSALASGSGSGSGGTSGVGVTNGGSVLACSALGMLVAATLSGMLAL